MGPAEKAARLQQRAAKLAAEKRSPEAPESLAAPIALMPKWPQGIRGIPNAALRSSLFSAVRTRQRPYIDRQPIHAQNGFNLLQSGPLLDQGDLDAWEAVLHMALIRRQSFSFKVSSYELLKLQGKADAGTNRKTLHARLVRLKASAVEICYETYTYIGSLIDEVVRDEASGLYIIRLNPMLSTLFRTGAFSHVDRQIRAALTGKPLAQWLHGYYSSHARPLPVKMETLLRLAGSHDHYPRSAFQNLKRALDALELAHAECGQEFEYRIEGSLVHVNRQRKQQEHSSRRTPSKVIHSHTEATAAGTEATAAKYRSHGCKIPKRRLQKNLQKDPESTVSSGLQASPEKSLILFNTF
ncbi:hypothetical protein [Pseudomonas fluvialis]|uniref:TrfA protein n=1 Tax=Pseudomonas fluvialis TaxID=1793966 RepID=A0ABQ2ALT7_9PSED|nr:hypothetical protein [Pseudomonas fluvialis]GGH93467.1 hypothetical protein GCM10007363_18140 [Pseudomonas fluvialis]